MPRARSSTTIGPDEIALAPRARLEVLVIVAASLVGIVARLFPSSPLWLDEALTVNIADQPIGSITDALRHDGHPPLYYYALSGWMNLFGTSDFAVRSLSMALGFIALALTFVIARRHGGRELAAMTAFVMAVSPYGVRYSNETRMYALVMVLVLIGWLALDMAIAKPTVLRLLPLTLLSGALLLTHYWCFFLIAGLVWLLGMHAWFVPGERKSHMRAAIAIVAGGILFIPWLGGFWYQLRHTGTPWASTARPTRVVSESLVDFNGGLNPEADPVAARHVVPARGRRVRTPRPQSARARPIGRTVGHQRVRRARQHDRGRGRYHLRHQERVRGPLRRGVLPDLRRARRARTGPSRAQLGAHGRGGVDRAVLAQRCGSPDPLA